MTNKIILTAVAGVVLLSGCNTVNQSLANRQEVVEIYHIFDFKTQADVATVSRAAANGLAQNTNSVQSSTPLQIGNMNRHEFSRHSQAAGNTAFHIRPATSHC